MRSLVTLFMLLAAVVLMTVPATAHHSTAGEFDMSKQVTLEGEIVRVEWINPHVLMHLQAKNAKGESEEWILQGFAPGPAIGRGLKREKLALGTHITVLGYPPRPAQAMNARTSVYNIAGGDPSKSSHIIEAGEIKLSNGDIQIFGRGPGFGTSSKK